MAKINIKSIDGDVKGINFEPWGGIDGFLAATSLGAGGTKEQQLRRVVPWLAKATDMTANAVSSLPFDIVDDAGNVKDTSTDWQNKTGGMKSPELLFYKLAASLCMGQAYAIPTMTSKEIIDIQYCAPQTVTPQIDATGIKYFQRSTDKGKNEIYYPAELDQDPVMLYFWLPDPDVEIGPALSYPAGAALLSSQLLFNMDGTINTYSERGFVPATLLSAKGMPGPAEREKAENWWNRFLRGWTKEAAKIVNAEAMTVNRVGAGMDELKGSYNELTKQMIENIGTAYGIPAGMFMSDAAYATELNGLIRVWYTTASFVRIYKTIEQTFTDQLLNQWGWALKFRPENLDAFKDDQTNNAAVYNTLISTGIKPSAASQIAGLRLPEGVKPEMLDQWREEKQAADIEKQQATFGGNDKPNKEKPIEARDIDEPKEERDLWQKSLTLSAAEIEDLNLWRQIAERKYRKDGKVVADFKCKALPDEIAAEICERLKVAKSIDDITAAFEMTPRAIAPDDSIDKVIKMLEMNLILLDKPAVSSKEK